MATERTSAHSNFPEVKWTEHKPPEQPYFLRYCDHLDVVTERTIRRVCIGKAGNGTEYLGGYDAEGFKIFRTDRILDFEEPQSQ